ncbi:hypothetical protein EJ04DRAFT_567165 [Polyplosphaeria fusca]|uniref:Uncharacterized protein n=1 Tax=Polyplosphaeria fusca TaxID=682080 RepID=A0A9P4V0B2_9PLEO|nr:hypothetical protein EJ04DRAFT_567165 [Polyplosphaeria fusca]
MRFVTSLILALGLANGIPARSISHQTRSERHPTKSTALTDAALSPLTLTRRSAPAYIIDIDAIYATLVGISLARAFLEPWSTPRDVTHVDDRDLQLPEIMHHINTRLDTASPITVRTAVPSVRMDVSISVRLHSASPARNWSEVLQRAGGEGNFRVAVQRAVLHSLARNARISVEHVLENRNTEEFDSDGEENFLPIHLELVAVVVQWSALGSLQD